MVTARLRVLIALPAAAGTLLLSGCGDPGTEPGAQPDSVASSSASSSPSAPAPTVTGTKIPLPPPVDLPTASGKPVTLDGVIEQGVEPGCKVLVTGTTSYLVLGGEDVPTGVPVRVEGVLQPGVLSTCQQGTPLRVTEVKRR